MLCLLTQRDWATQPNKKWTKKTYIYFYWKHFCLHNRLFRVFLVFFIYFNGTGWYTVRYNFRFHSVILLLFFAMIFVHILLLLLKGNWNWLFWCTINARKLSVMGLYCNFFCYLWVASILPFDNNFFGRVEGLHYWIVMSVNIYVWLCGISVVFFLKFNFIILVFWNFEII